MKINEINSQNFKGIYRIKNTPQNMEALKNVVIPTYEFLRNEPARIFKGENPFSEFLINIGIKKVANVNHYSEQWVIQNAKNHGIKFEEDKSIYIITGEEDKKALLKYMENLADSLDLSKLNYFQRLRLCRREFKKWKKAFSSDVPNYLTPIIKAFIENDIQTKRFASDFLSKYNVKDCETVTELLNKIMTNK